MSEASYYGRCGNRIYSRHRNDARGRHRRCGRQLPVLPNGGQAWDCPLGGAHFRFVSRAGWGDAMYHLMLCDEFTSAEAYRIGLVQEVVPAAQQNERAIELARIISRNAPLGIQVTKEAGRKFIEGGEQAAIAVVPKVPISDFARAHSERRIIPVIPLCVGRRSSGRAIRAPYAGHGL
jgi:Enoyl-CoA hydratase/isomerase